MHTSIAFHFLFYIDDDNNMNCILYNNIIIICIHRNHVYMYIGYNTNNGYTCIPQEVVNS